MIVTVAECMRGDWGRMLESYYYNEYVFSILEVEIVFNCNDDYLDLYL